MTSSVFQERASGRHSFSEGFLSSTGVRYKEISVGVAVPAKLGYYCAHLG
jgi:hypothetical protein